MATAIRNTQVSDAEWEARQQLAACYRVFDMLGWSEMIYNHITLKVPGEDGAFLINPFGLHFSEVTASNLVKIDLDGNKLDGSRSEEHTSELQSLMRISNAVFCSKKKT